jgi:hypothetical protein
MNWKGYGRKQSNLIAIMSRHLCGGVEENHENPVKIADFRLEIQTNHF